MCTDSAHVQRTQSDESIQNQHHGQQRNSEITYAKKKHLKSPPAHLGRDKLTVSFHVYYYLLLSDLHIFFFFFRWHYYYDQNEIIIQLRMWLKWKNVLGPLYT